MSDSTAVILIDPYNEFLHPDGKLNHKIATSLRDMDTIKHLKQLVTAARANKSPIYYGFHQQTNAHSWDGWKHATKAQGESRANRAFEAGSFGAQIYEDLEPSVENGDVVVSKHWSWRFVRLFAERVIYANTSSSS
jgi:nicotinamidase-related amidase